MRNEILVEVFMEQVCVIKKNKSWLWSSQQYQKVMEIESKLAFIAWINVFPWWHPTLGCNSSIGGKEEKCNKNWEDKSLGLNGLGGALAASMLLIITTSAALFLCSPSALQAIHFHADILGLVLEIIILIGIVGVSVLLLLRTSSWKLKEM